MCQGQHHYLSVLSNGDPAVGVAHLLCVLNVLLCGEEVCDERPLPGTAMVRYPATLGMNLHVRGI